MTYILYKSYALITIFTVVIYKEYAKMNKEYSSESVNTILESVYLMNKTI